LKKHNLCPKYILLTHGHFDHITALPELLAAFTGKTQQIQPVVAIHGEDASYLRKGADKTLSEGEIIGPFRVIHVPGHTPGSIAFYDEKEGLLFTGDTLFNADCGRTDLPGGSQAQLLKSLERLLAMNGNIKVLPGHGRETTIADESKRGLSFFK